MKHIKQLLLASFLMIFSSLVSANSYYGADHRSPAAGLAESIESLFTYLKQNPHQDPVKIRQFVGQYLMPHFDFNRMARLVAARHFRGMTKKQKNQFASVLRHKFLKAMLSRLDSAPAGKIMYLPVKRYRRNELRFSIKIPQSRGVPAKVTFKLHNVAGQWKIFDVMAGGQSAVVFYRKYYAFLIGINGLPHVLQSSK